MSQKVRTQLLNYFFRGGGGVRVARRTVLVDCRRLSGCVLRNLLVDLAK